MIQPKALARSYNTPSYPDPWNAVEDYRHVSRYASEHPDKGSQAVATKLELPRERIRAWVDSDGKPDVVHGLERARDRGWVDVDPASDTAVHFAILVGGLFSGGSLTIESGAYRPRWTVNRGHVHELIKTALDGLDVDTHLQREREPNRATEIVPRKDASLLGRVLAVLGAPTGPKDETQPLALPSWLDAAPRPPRRAFVEIYLSNRATLRPDRDEIQLSEVRSDRYRRELARLIESVTGADVTVGTRNLRLDESVLDEFLQESNQSV